MSYKIINNQDIPKEEKHGISLDIYPNMGDCGLVTVDTETGHNQEFYDVESTFNYIVLEGNGQFFLDDEEVPVQKGDFVSIAPKTRIYYKGKMKLILVINPTWKPENEVETKPKIW